MFRSIVSHEVPRLVDSGANYNSYMVYFMLSRNLNCMFRCIVSDETPYTGGFGCELEAPIQFTM